MEPTHPKLKQGVTPFHQSNLLVLVCKGWLSHEGPPHAWVPFESQGHVHVRLLSGRPGVALAAPRQGRQASYQGPLRP